MNGKVYESNSVSEREKQRIFVYIQELCRQTYPECTVKKYAHSVIIKGLSSWPDVYSECLKVKYPFLTIDILDSGDLDDRWMVCVGFGKNRRGISNMFLLVLVFLMAFMFLVLNVDFFVQETLVAKNPYANNNSKAHFRRNKTLESVFPKRSAI